MRLAAHNFYGEVVALKRDKILVADSGETSRKLLCETLISFGFWTFQSTDGPHTLRLARKLKPQLVILDAGLWGLPAKEVGKIIETDGLSTVLFMTGHITPDFMAMVGQRQVAAYITKPIQTRQMTQMLNIALVHSHQIAELHQQIRHLEQQLEKDKLVNQAKTTLMAVHGYTEPEAYTFMRNMAMESRSSIEQVARRICGSNPRKS